MTFMLFAVAQTLSPIANVNVAKLGECAARRSTPVVANTDDLPKDITAQLKQLLPGIAQTGLVVQINDVETDINAPKVVFVGAVRNRRSWVVIYQRAGQAFVHGMLFGERNDVQPGHYRLFSSSLLEGPACSILEAELAGVAVAQDGNAIQVGH